MKKLLFFAEINKDMGNQVGGKGANLGEMTQAGIAVPDGFCLTTAVYDEFIAGLNLADLEPAQARELLQSQALPADCQKLLAEALQNFPQGALFSVRSSATAEDLPFASFAGQQDTYLNVAAADLPQAVINCFASLYTDRAVSYRRQNSITKASMAVVVQQMVRSEASGVMFTADPVSGHRSKLVIDAVFVLGEAIVSGLVSPDHYAYERQTGQIAEKTIACKEFAIRPQADGGTVNEKLHSTQPVLTDTQIIELARIGEKLEAHYGCPQDVEWAVENGQIYILQTRAITSLYPAPQFDDEYFHFLFCLGYQQMNTNAMPNLALDMLLGTMNITGTPFDNYQPSICRSVGQHIFSDFSQICALPVFGSIFVDKILNLLDPVAISAIKELLARNRKLKRPDKAVQNIGKKLVQGIVHYTHAGNPEMAALNLLQNTELNRKRIADYINNAPLDRSGLQTIFNEVNIIPYFVGNFIPCIFSGVLALKKLQKLEDKLGCQNSYTQYIQQGSSGNVVTEMNLLLGDLADLTAATPELAALLASEQPDIQADLLARNDEFGQKYRQFMELYGFRCAGELDIALPRWQDDPTPLLAQILAAAKNKEPGSHQQEYLNKNQQADIKAEELIAKIAETLGKEQAKKARKLVNCFRAYAALREHLKYFWMSNYGAARKKLLEFARLLVENKQLYNSEDIFHLHLTEVANALTNGQPLQEIVLRNREEFERVKRLTPPRFITSEGEVLMGGLQRDGLPDKALVGFGVSAGCVDGVAKVVLDPLNATVEKGEILIAPFTDPGWTPLFVNAAAVVTEIGGMLTHGAVVAREYGIPGLVGVSEATKLISTGQKIRVDGTSGYVLPLD